MKTSTQKVLALVIIILGILLILGGILTGKHGATVVGICISGVAAQRYIVLRKKKSDIGKT